MNLRQAIVAHLRADPDLTLLLPGGVHEDIPIKPKNWQAIQEWETAQPWDQLTGRLRPMAVVKVRGIGTLFSGTPRVLAGVARGGSTTGVEIWIYEAAPGLRRSIEAAKWRVVDLLDYQSPLATPFVTDNEGTAVLKLQGYLGDNEGDPELHAVVERLDFKAAVLVGVQ